MLQKFFVIICFVSGTIVNIQTIQTTNLACSTEVIVGKIYQHYSGKQYRVLAIARDSEDPALLRVVYQGLYDCPTFGPNPIWVRSYQMFVEQVTLDNIEMPRFALVTSQTDN